MQYPVNLTTGKSYIQEEMIVGSEQIYDHTTGELTQTRTVEVKAPDGRLVKVENYRQWQTFSYYDSSTQQFQKRVRTNAQVIVMSIGEYDSNFWPYVAIETIDYQNFGFQFYDGWFSPRIWYFPKDKYNLDYINSCTIL